MKYRIAGRSLVAYGAVVLVSSVAIGVILDRLSVDPLALAVLALGIGVYHGSAVAARWSVAIMAFYFVFALLGLVGLSQHPGLVRVAGSVPSLGGVPWVWATNALEAAWAACNVALLVLALRSGDIRLTKTSHAGSRSPPRGPVGVGCDVIAIALPSHLHRRWDREPRKPWKIPGKTHANLQIYIIYTVPCHFDSRTVVGFTGSFTFTLFSAIPRLPDSPSRAAPERLPSSGRYSDL